MRMSMSGPADVLEILRVFETWILDFYLKLEVKSTWPHTCKFLLANESHKNGQRLSAWLRKVIKVKVIAHACFYNFSHTKLNKEFIHMASSTAMQLQTGKLSV